jgi:DNA-binding beta-propeller fold protein YncE
MAIHVIPRLSLIFLCAMLLPAMPGALAGGNPDEGRPGSVWVVNRDRGELVVFDAKTGELATSTPLSVGAGAHDVCISEPAGKAYITAETIHAVTEVDIGTLKTESIAVGPLPHHLEPSRDGRTIFVSLQSHPVAPVPPGQAQYAAIDAHSHVVTYTTTSANPFARSHGPRPSVDGKTLYVAHDTGNELTAIDTGTGQISLSVTPIPRAEEAIPTRDGHVIWVSARGDGTVKRIDLNTINPGPPIIDSVPIGVQPESVMLTPEERTLVASLRGSPASLAFVDTVTLDAKTLPIAGTGTFGDLAVMTPDGRFVYATFDAGATGAGGVAVVDVRARTVVDTWAYPGTGRPHGIWYTTRKAKF